jgi:hypothetical protein
VHYIMLIREHKHGCGSLINEPDISQKWSFLTMQIILDFSIYTRYRIQLGIIKGGLRKFSRAIVDDCKSLKRNRRGERKGQE